MTIRPRFSTTLMCALLVAFAALPLRNVFGDWQWALSVLGAAGAAAGIASISESLRRDLPLATLALLTAIGATAWTLLVPLRDVYSGAPVAGTPWRELRDGVLTGWGALLGDHAPLTDPLSAEVFATFLVWIAAGSAVHIAARRHTALGAIAASAAILWISTAAALPSGLAPAVLGAGAGVIALFAVSSVTRAPDQRWQPGRVLGLVSIIGFAGAVATLIGSASTAIGQDPFDPRSSRNTEVVAIEVPDLLAEYGVRRAETPTSVAVIESATLPPSLRLRLQVYETYDGERWLPAADFEEIATFPEVDTLPPGDVVNLEVTVEALDGPWVPLPDRLISTDLTDLQWSQETQTGLVASPPEHYAVIGTLVEPTGLQGLEAAPDQVAPQLSDVPASLPDSIRAAAEAEADDATDAITAIDAITARVRELGRDETVVPGHSLARLDADLSNARATGAEQIASLHALMLRVAGIPSRLVVGYTVSSPVLESSDLHIWTEAALPGVGWVTFDPVPAATDVGADTGEEPAATTTTLPDQTVLEARALPSELEPGADPDEAEIDTDDPLTRRELALISIAALIALPASIAGLRTIRRRLRKSAGIGPEACVLGAWAELIDRLRELGVPIDAMTTIDDVIRLATEIDEALGRDARAIADLAAVALHSQEGSTPDEASHAWQLLIVAEARILEVRGRMTALRRYLDPRVLHYRAPIPPPSRHGGHRTTPTKLSPLS